MRGSSCAHTTSAVTGYRASMSEACSAANGYNCSTRTNRHVSGLPFLASGKQIVVNLAGTEHHAAHARHVRAIGLADNFREPARRKIAKRRNRARMPQQALGREDDQRFAHPAPVRARRTSAAAARGSIARACVQLHHLHVVLGAQRQKPLDARARMLRPLPFVTVRQQHHEPARLPPLRFRRRNELVDHDLRAVGEIAELRLPHHQRQRIRHAVAELEPQHRVLAERAVIHVEARLVRRDVLQRHILRRSVSES